MKKIIIAGFGQPVIDLFQSLKERFEILGIIPDYDRRAKFPFFYDFIEVQKLSILSFEAIEGLHPDAIIVVNYNKIIDVSKIKVPYLLNIHIGLLPVYRGNNANSWAILNGDRTVGYTLHEVNEVLDGGAIYYTFSYEIQAGETYYHAKKAMNEDLADVLPGIIEKVLNGSIEAVSQENEDFIYTSKLMPEDGILRDWNYTTEEILQRNIIFSKPLGTGLKMIYKGEMIEISKISTIPNYKVSKGLVGAVVLKNANGSVWIKTKDTAISIDELIIDNKCLLPATLFKIGQRL